MSAPDVPPTPARWLNADGTTSPILPATSASAEATEAPSQEFLQALVAAEQDRLRAEGWRACVECIRREYRGMLMGEDTYWLGRKNPYGSGVAGNPAFAEYQRGMVEGARQVSEAVEKYASHDHLPSVALGARGARAAAHEALARIEGEA